MDGGSATASGQEVELAPLVVKPVAFDDLHVSALEADGPWRLCMEAASPALRGVLSEGQSCIKVKTDGDGACALHAGFGSWSWRSRVFRLPDARALAARALLALLDSVPDGLGAERLRASSPRWHLVVVAFWGMVVDACRRRGYEGREAKILWSVCSPEVQARIAEVVENHHQAVDRQREAMVRFDKLARRLCVEWRTADEFVRRVAKEVQGLDITVLPEDIEQFCDVAYHAWLGPAYEQVRGELIVKGTFKNPVPFPLMGPANKYVALFDARREFDGLRQAFFVTGDREMQTRIIQILCECERGDSNDVVVDFRELLLHGMADLNSEPAVFDGFDIAAVAAFARACADPRYWFSLDELLFLADVVGEMVVVVELRDGGAHFAGSSKLQTGKPLALVGIDSNRAASVRSHFSRMVMVPDAAAAATAASSSVVAAAAEDAEANDAPRSGLGSSAPTLCGRDAEPAAGPLASASASVSYASSRGAGFRWEGSLLRFVGSGVVSVASARSQVRRTSNRRVWMLCGKLFSWDRLLEQAPLLCVVGVAFHSVRLVLRFHFGWCSGGLVVSIVGDCG